MDDTYNALPYCNASMKASHNSYQRQEDLVEQLTWYFDHPYNSGCRSVELDISQSKTGNKWSVGHLAGYHTDYRQLSQFLAELRRWNRGSPNHDVITLYLDLKSVQPSFPEQLDQYIRDYLDSPIYAPGELMGDAPDLAAGARQNGWPTLGDLRGKFIVVLTGGESDKSKYADTDPRRRQCFADKSRDADQAPESKSRVFFNYHLWTADTSKWTKTFKAAAGRRDAVIRGYVLNKEELWKNALKAGCHILATDEVSGHKWAKVADAPFTELKPLAAAATA